MKNKVIILLSSKSSGSSAFQHYLNRNFNINLIRVAGHYENETLFFTKAASFLRRNQLAMHRSQVPYSYTMAKRLLEILLADNGVTSALTDEPGIFKAFESMIGNNGPTVFEKSPHHLYNYSNIELILKCREFLSDKVDFYILGLVRNPMDTVYSAWSRWRFNCKSFEREWGQSYNNLLQLKVAFPELVIFKYESLIEDPTSLDQYLKSIDIEKKSSDFRFKPTSRGKWKSDMFFAHKLSKQACLVASQFGYPEDEMLNLKSAGIAWMLSEWKNQVKYAVRKMFRNG